jgi:hypothetical protein
MSTSSNDNSDRRPFRSSPPTLPALSLEPSWQELARAYATLSSAYFEERKDIVQWAKSIDARLTNLESIRTVSVPIKWVVALATITGLSSLLALILTLSR